MAGLDGVDVTIVVVFADRDGAGCQCQSHCTRKSQSQFHEYEIVLFFFYFHTNTTQHDVCALLLTGIEICLLKGLNSPAASIDSMGRCESALLVASKPGSRQRHSTSTGEHSDCRSGDQQCADGTTRQFHAQRPCAKS